MSRKYRQRGYLQDDERERSTAGPRGPGPDRECPRGRGLGRPTGEAFRCARCGERLAVSGTGVAVDATCPGCGSDLHACTQCAWFDTSAPFECRQTIPVRIASKARRNECELFAPKLVSEHQRDEPRPDSARAAFDDLFNL